jgi:hypothetical protein
MGHQKHTFFWLVILINVIVLTKYHVIHLVKEDKQKKVYQNGHDLIK